MDDPYDLARFVEAQRSDYAQALSELRDGRKHTHWIWYVFPQIAGLGASPTAQRYAIASLDEARAYLAHPVLGDRLRTCTDAILGVTGRTAHAVFGSPDDVKVRSSLTLFGRADPTDARFQEALAKYYGGQEDERTLEKLAL